MVRSFINMVLSKSVKQTGMTFESRFDIINA